MCSLNLQNPGSGRDEFSSDTSGDTDFPAQRPRECSWPQLCVDNSLYAEMRPEQLRKQQRAWAPAGYNGVHGARKGQSEFRSASRTEETGRQPRLAVGGSPNRVSAPALTQSLS